MGRGSNLSVCRQECRHTSACATRLRDQEGGCDRGAQYREPVAVARAEGALPDAGEDGARRGLHIGKVPRRRPARSMAPSLVERRIQRRTCRSGRRRRRTGSDDITRLAGDPLEQPLDLFMMLRKRLRLIGWSAPVFSREAGTGGGRSRGCAAESRGKRGKPKQTLPCFDATNTRVRAPTQRQPATATRQPPSRPMRAAKLSRLRSLHEEMLLSPRDSCRRMSHSRPSAVRQ